MGAKVNKGADGVAKRLVSGERGGALRADAEKRLNEAVKAIRRERELSEEKLNRRATL